MNIHNVKNLLKNLSLVLLVLFSFHVYASDEHGHDEGEDGGRVVTPMKGIGLGLGLGLSSGQAWGNLGRRRAGSAE